MRAYSFSRQVHRARMRADGSEFDVLRALALLDEERAASEFAARGWAVG